MKSLILQYHKQVNKAMLNIQAEKYSIIEALTKVNDINLIQKVKDILSKNKEVIGYQADGTSITKIDLMERAKESNQAIKEGRVKTLQQIKEESKNW